MDQDEPDRRPFGFYWRPDHNAPSWAQHLAQHIFRRLEQIMAALDDLQAADTALQATVTQVLTDFAAAVAAAGVDPVALAQVTADMTAMAAQLTAADPATPPAPPAS